MAKAWGYERNDFIVRLWMVEEGERWEGGLYISSVDKLCKNRKIGYKHGTHSLKEYFR